MTTKANDPMASGPTSGVNDSPKIQTLSAMLTMGSTMTMNGWDMLSGPTWNAACIRNSADRAVTASAYSGQWVNMPGRPNWVSVSVVALINVATSAQRTEAEAPRRAARLAGEPPRARRASSPAVAAVAELADTQAPLVGRALPPLGSAIARKTVSEIQVMPAAHQVTLRMDWWNQSHRRTRTKTSSVTRSGWTTDIGPLCRAMAWKMNAPASAAHPSSHNGLDTR